MVTLSEWSARDGERVARAIRFLEQHYRQQPSLGEVAGAVGLSAFHFQRLFRRWAGVSPKRFLQFLTVEHAKAALHDGSSVLEASYDAGLSGPGRLHDLFVAVDAVTPGEFKDGGRGVAIRYGFHSSPFGDYLLAVTERGICGLSFTPVSGRDLVLEELARRWNGAALERDQGATDSLAARIFRNRPSSKRPLTLALRGTNFQIKVWEALLRIPDGALASYRDIARGIGRPKAYRAVASAVAQNPVAYLIPCHRVIRCTGAFGEYRWGAARKKAMIGWEAARKRSAVSDQRSAVSGCLIHARSVRYRGKCREC